MNQKISILLLAALIAQNGFCAREQFCGAESANKVLLDFKTAKAQVKSLGAGISTDKGLEVTFSHAGDGIMITAAVDHIPPPLLKQLKNGARLILPLGNPFSYQYLVLVTKRGNDFITKQITGVRFVPLTGHGLDKSNTKR